MVYLQNSSVKINSEEDLKTYLPSDSSLKELKISLLDEKSGHRKRVKERFSKQDISIFSNAEIIEALLFFCNPRRDVKTEARLLEKLSQGSILKFLFLTEDHLETAEVKYVNDNLLFLNKVILELSSRYFRDKITEFSFKNIKEIGDYLVTRSGYLAQEQLRILFLNSKNKLIEDVVFSKGTVNETAIYIREVVTVALKKSAISLIVSHNHPSGDVTPSREDINITYNLKQALETVSITLQDHIVISGIKYFSFKNEGLL